MAEPTPTVLPCPEECEDGYVETNRCSDRGEWREDVPVMCLTCRGQGSVSAGPPLSEEESREALAAGNALVASPEGWRVLDTSTRGD